jgi:rod shape-determining protein MreD
MVDPVTAARLGYRALYLAVAALILLAGMLPLSSVPPRWPPPDLLVAVTFALVLRRPDYVPASLVVVIFFIEDTLSMRPPGLWTVIVLLGTEFLRSRVALVREMPFLVEWLMVSVVLGAMGIAQYLVLSLFLVPQPGFPVTAIQIAGTLVVYPAVVLATRWLIGLRRLLPGEADAIGGRA